MGLVLSLAPKHYYDTRFSNVAEADAAGRASQMSDLTGNEDAIQADTALQPNFGLRKIGSNRAISTGTDAPTSGYFTTEILAAAGVEDEDWTICVALAVREGDSTNRQMLHVMSTGNTMRFQTAGAPGDVRLNVISGPGGTWNPVQTAPQEEGVFFAYGYDASAGTEFKQINGDKQTRTTAATASSTGPTNVDWPSSNNSADALAIGAIAVFDRTLDDADLATMRDAFAGFEGEPLQ